MNHVEMMRLAERVTQNSDCADRKVGAVVVLAEGGAISASNTAAWDDTNDNHAESKLIIMVELMRKSLEGATLYTTCRPCARCTAILLGRGIKAIYYRDRQPEMGHLQELVKDGVYLNSGWIAGQLPAPLEQVQQTWVERWQ
jgi:deoxycytidylate deaminase